MLSTVTATCADVTVLPRPSTARAVRAWAPFATCVLSQEIWPGLAVAVETTVPSTSSSRLASFVPVPTVASAENMTVPRTAAPSDGEVTRAEGGPTTAVDTEPTMSREPVSLTVSDCTPGVLKVTESPFATPATNAVLGGSVAAGSELEKVAVPL